MGPVSLYLANIHHVHVFNETWLAELRTKMEN